MLIVTAATTLPISVALARAQLAAPENGDDDVEVERALRSAIEYVEEHTGLALAPQTLEYRLECWPAWCAGYRRGYEIDLPRKPVRDILSVEYLDADGNLQTVSTSDYSWRTTPEGAVIRFRNSYSFPSIYDEANDAIHITFEAGFDDPASSGSGDDPNLALPQRAVEAVLLKAELLYDRGSLKDGADQQIETALGSLLGQLRVYR